MANNNYFKIYLSQVFALAETLVIKSVASAESINKLIISELGGGAVNLNDPTTWKYYRNICGEYHELDQVMEVVSLDTLEKITFDKENLKKHRRTARAYQYGSKLYNELVNRFKTQEMLILGILYPANMTEAINAKDGTILSYPATYVEENEYSFIERLQEWIYNFRKLSNNPQYQVSDYLSESVSLSQLYIHLVPAIMNIRLRACRTNEAHSYHVRSYLASHGFLDEYLDYLTKKQALWFYRNINYIERYSGHQDTFNWLMENVLTAREIPVGEYRMRHDTSKQPTGVYDFDTKLVETGEALYPQVNFLRRILNGISVSTAQTVVDIDYIFDKEKTIARDNERFQEDDIKETQFKMRHSLSNTLMTKVLESGMYDYSDSFTYKLSDILLNQWIYQAFEGNYKAIVTVTNPKTGENIPLNSKDALYLMFYAYCKGQGIPVTHLPGFTADRIPIVPTPEVDYLRKHVPHDRISVEATELMRGMLPLPATFYSIDDFYLYARRLWLTANLQNNLILFYDDKDDRAYAENMINRLYGIKVYPKVGEFVKGKNIVKEVPQYLPGFDNTALIVEYPMEEDPKPTYITRSPYLKGWRDNWTTMVPNTEEKTITIEIPPPAKGYKMLPKDPVLAGRDITVPNTKVKYDSTESTPDVFTGVPYKTWLAERSINLDTLDDEDFANLADRLLAEGTGANLDTSVNIRGLQKAMINIFTQLSSYSIQFLSEINLSNIRQLDLQYIRPGERQLHTSAEVFITDLYAKVTDVEASASMELELDTNNIDEEDTIDTTVHQYLEYTPPKIIDENHVKMTLYIDAPMSRPTVGFDYGIWPNRLDYLPTWGTEEVLQIPTGEEHRLVDVYQFDYGKSGE